MNHRLGSRICDVIKKYLLAKGKPLKKFHLFLKLEWKRKLDHHWKWNSDEFVLCLRTGKNCLSESCAFAWRGVEVHSIYDVNNHLYSPKETAVCACAPAYVYAYELSAATAATW